MIFYREGLRLRVYSASPAKVSLTSYLRGRRFRVQGCGIEGLLWGSWYLEQGSDHLDHYILPESEPTSSGGCDDV